MMLIKGVQPMQLFIRLIDAHLPVPILCVSGIECVSVGCYGPTTLRRDHLSNLHAHGAIICDIMQQLHRNNGGRDILWCISPSSRAEKEYGHAVAT